MRNLFALTFCLILATSTYSKVINLNLETPAGQNTANAGAISMKVGDVLRIQVEENPTTGFVWISEATSNGSLFKVAKNTFYTSEELGKRKTYGAPGTRVIELVAQHDGQAEYTMVEARIWEFKGFNSLNANRNDFVDIYRIKMNI